MANRLTGLFFTVFGLVLLLLVIPAQTDPVDYGWLRPATLPNAMAAVLVAAGLVLVVWPRGEVVLDPRRALRAAGFFTLVGAGVWLIALAGYAVAAPPLALAMLFYTGERRPRWLLVGTVAVPAAIWLAVALLGRPLP